MCMNGERDIVPYVYEVVPLIPDMPSITYEESHTVASWLDGWVDDIGDELAQKVIDIEEYFSRSLDRSYPSRSVGEMQESYVCLQWQAGDCCSQEAWQSDAGIIRMG